jgi:hypothetical protein
MRRFPPPWTVEPLDARYKVVDANGQTLAYVYGLTDSRNTRIANSLTLDEARRIMLSCEIFGTADLIGEGGEDEALLLSGGLFPRAPHCG